MTKRQVTIYKVYDENGNMIFRGSGKEIAEKFFSTYSDVWRAGNGTQKTYLGKYKVVPENEREIREV